MERYDIQVATPKNAHGRSNLIKANGIERFVRHAWKEPNCGAIFILVDAEDDCPKSIAKDFVARIDQMGVLFPVLIVCANRMYENWFFASLETILEKHMLWPSDKIAGITIPDDVELIASAKSRINSYFPKGRAYKETQDQESMTYILDFDLAKRRSRSFRRLCHALEEALEAIDQNSKIITPIFID